MGIKMNLKTATAKRMSIIFLALMLPLCLTACGGVGSSRQSENVSAPSAPDGPQSSETADISKLLPSEEAEDMEQSGADKRIYITAGDSTFTATLEENTAVEAFTALMEDAPVVIRMRDYSGFEKVGSLGTDLPADNTRTTTQSGDIVLYNGNQIVIFYGSNTWSYTKLGKIDDLTGWEDALGSGDVTVTFSLK